jgi:hypothetical protein
VTATDLQAACEALDRALAARPRLDGDALTEATKALCRRRDALRRLRGDGAEARKALKEINGLVTLVHASHYPLGAIPWDLLQQARLGVGGLMVEDPALHPALQG